MGPAMKVRFILSGLLLTSLSCAATTYPVTITDMDNQKITLEKEPERVILQDGRDIMALALLDREMPFKRVVAWNNLLKKQDGRSWALLSEKWPDAKNIIDMGFSDQGEINLESVLAKQPDIMIAQLRAKPALEQGGVIEALKKLNIPVIFVDYELHPLENTAKSVDLLGTVLNQESRAKEYTDYYQQQLNALQQVTKAEKNKPTVFIEPIAGNSENCCFTHGHNGWGGLVEAVGGKNIGSELLPGSSGFISIEKIIAMKPDIYIMTGSKRTNQNVLPFGYNVSKDEVAPAFNKLLSRATFETIEPVQKGKVFGVYHHFYNHPYNIIGMEVLAKDFYPQALQQLNPEADYHHIIKSFTQIPDSPVTLSYSLQDGK